MGWRGSPAKPFAVVAAAASEIIVRIVPATSRAQRPFEMHSATAPVTCGAAMLVPEMVLTPPPGHVDVMHTPGALMRCGAIVAVVAKSEKLAAVSSRSLARHAGARPRAPGRPSLSDIAVTVSTSG